MTVVNFLILLVLLAGTVHAGGRGQVVNVKDWGVTETGDQTDRINEIIAANRGRIIFFPKGTYRVRSIKVNNDIVLDGAGKEAVLLFSGRNSREPVLDLRKGNVTVNHLTIDGNARSGIGIYICDYFNTGYSITIKNCIVRNIYGSRTTGGYGIQINRNSRQVNIFNTFISNIDGPEDGIVGNQAGANRGIYINNVSSVLVSGCIIDHVKGYEDGDGIQYFRWDRKAASNVIIRHNLFRNIYKRAIKIQADNATVIDNQVYGYWNGHHANYAAISIYGNNNIVDNNKISLKKAFCAIEVGGSKQHRYRNNKVRFNNIRIASFSNPYFHAPIPVQLNDVRTDSNVFNGSIIPVNVVK